MSQVTSTEWILLGVIFVLCGIVLIQILFPRPIQITMVKAEPEVEAETREYPMEAMNAQDMRNASADRAKGLQQLTPAPMFDGVTLYEWLIRYHPMGENVWSAVVTEMYERAATVPEIKSYFYKVLYNPDGSERAGGLAKLHSHFFAMLTKICRSGVTQAMVNTLAKDHEAVRDDRGRPIDGAIYDMVITILITILNEQKVPWPAVEALRHTISPLKAAIVRA